MTPPLPQCKTIENCAVELIAHTSLDKGIATTEQMDVFPATAARVSFTRDTQRCDFARDIKLINYLADHEHLTPFEYQHATVMIECPLFIRSQIHRHRTFSYNEISRRYTSDELAFWVPDDWHKQAKDNKQASDGNVEGSIDLYKIYEDNLYHAVHHYLWLLEQGVAREQARAILPQSLLTRFYMGGNLRNWAHFLKLREDSHAQYEVQVIARKIHKILSGLWPNSVEALMK